MQALFKQIRPYRHRPYTNKFGVTNIQTNMALIMTPNVGLIRTNLAFAMSDLFKKVRPCSNKVGLNNSSLVQ